MTKLKRELSGLKKIDHPNVVKVFAHYYDESSHYLVQEFCEMGDLEAYLKTLPEQGEFTFRPLFAGIAKALAHCHKLGIAHRDLKPENIMVAMVEGQPVAKVIDFGLAKESKVDLY